RYRPWPGGRGGPGRRMLDQPGAARGGPGVLRPQENRTSRQGAAMSQQFSSPPRLILGDGALNQLAAELEHLGSRALVVTDAGIVGAGILDTVVGVLSASGL